MSKIKALIIKCIAVISIVTLALVIIPTVPTEVGINLALGQLENSDTNFALMQGYNNAKNIYYSLEMGIVLLGIGFIIFLIYKYFKGE